MTHDHTQPDPAPRCFWGSRYSIGLVLLGAIAAYFLLSEHRAHVLGTLPLLLLALACPLIHAYMHRGYAGHAGRRDADPDGNPPPGSSAGASPSSRGDEP